MDRAAHRALTERLRDRLLRDARVIGLVAQGSTSARGRPPDEWSDHDFYVIAEPGRAEEMRSETAWLPDAGQIVLAFRDTPHGGKVLWSNGHLAEYAIFEPHELRLARTDRTYEVLIDRGGIAAAMDELARATEQSLHDGWRSRDLHAEGGRLIALLLVAAGRWRRGEHLSARALLSAAVTHHLAPLLAGGEPRIDPLRRFEERQPRIAAELDAVMRLDPDRAAIALLELAAREIPGFPTSAAEMVTGTISGWKR